MLEPPYEPTPEEIETARDEFQRGWSPAERARRLCYSLDSWTVPVVSTKDSYGNVDQDA